MNYLHQFTMEETKDIPTQEPFFFLLGNEYLFEIEMTVEKHKEQMDN